jgi:hypothetical protein
MYFPSRKDGLAGSFFFVYRKYQLTIKSGFGPMAGENRGKQSDGDFATWKALQNSDRPIYVTVILHFCAPLSF